jgi:hypothetical protein
MVVQFRNNKVLFRNNKVSFHSRCCCDELLPPIICSHCNGGLSPGSIQVNASGFSNAGCAGCTSFNGSKTIPSGQAGPGYLGCQFYRLLSTPCGVSTSADIIVEIVTVGLVQTVNIVFRVARTLQGIRFQAVYKKQFNPPETCLSWSNETATYNGGYDLDGDCGVPPASVQFSS